MPPVMKNPNHWKGALARLGLPLAQETDRGFLLRVSDLVRRTWAALKPQLETAYAWAKEQLEQLISELSLQIERAREDRLCFEIGTYEGEIGTPVTLGTTDGQEVSALLRISDITDPRRFALRLREGSGPFSAYLKGLLSPETQGHLARYEGRGAPSELLKMSLVDDLNLLITGRNLYEVQAFARTKLTAEIRREVESYQGPSSRAKLNRWLLEQHCPEIARHTARTPVLVQSMGVIALENPTIDRHLYVIGSSGAGKSKLLELTIRQHLTSGMGFALLDPHGDLTRDVMRFLYSESARSKIDLDRVRLIEPFRTDALTGFNPLDPAGGPLHPHISSLIASFRRLWANSWGVRMEDCLRHTLHALALAGFTLAEVIPFLTDPAFRARTLARVDDDWVKDYFAARYDPLSDAARQAVAEPLLNKMSALLADPCVRAMLSQREHGLNFRALMDGRAQVFINLSRGRLGGNSSLLGSFLVSQVYSAALSRANVPEAARKRFSLFVDEFQCFTGDGFETLLSECRKYRVRLIAAHQHLDQLDPSLRNSVFSNASTHIAFSTSPQDAAAIAREFTGGADLARELVHLPPRHAFLHRRGQPTLRFEVLPVPSPKVGEAELESFMADLRARHGRPLSQIEKEINARRILRSATPDPPVVGREAGGAKRGALHDDLSRPSGGETESGPVTEGDDD